MKYPEGKFIEQESRSVAAKNSGMWVEKGVGKLLIGMWFLLGLIKIFQN